MGELDGMLTDLKAEIIRVREKSHELSEEVTKKAPWAALYELQGKVGNLAERVARLEESAKDFALMKIAIAGALLEGLVALLLALYMKKGG